MLRQGIPLFEQRADLMSKKVKVLVITTSVILVMSMLVIFGVRGFVKSILKQRDCEWANIDNIELHARIDVPEIIASDCFYDQEINTKMASFKLEKSHLNVERYIQVNELKELGEDYVLTYDTFLYFDQDSIRNSRLYFKNTVSSAADSYILFDKTNSRLWVTIEYKD